MMADNAQVARMHCDIMVAGGSLEGCAAALTAAKSGKQVILTEKQGSLGGMASNGLAGWMEPTADQAAAQLRGELLRRLGCTDAAAGALYPDQKLKVVLGGLLRDAGVVWLDHVFLSQPVLESGTLRGFSVIGKTGAIQILCSHVIDATDTLETAGMLGLQFTAVQGRVSVAVKMNGFNRKAVRAVEKPAGGIAGTLRAPLAMALGGRNVSCGELRVLLRDHTEEALVSGLYCELPSFDPLSLSAAQGALRQFAYALRDHLRQNAAGMEALNIIHVAPRLNAYGLRQCENPIANLTLLNNDGEVYSNARALEKGVRA